MEIRLLRSVALLGLIGSLSAHSIQVPNKPETVLYKAPTFSLLLASRGGSYGCIVWNLHV